jgi:hypothetical protein
MRYIALAVLVLLLEGCSMFTEYRALKAVAAEGVTTGIEDVKDVADKKAEVYFNVPCATPIGAVNRYPDKRKRDLINELCGGDPADKPIVVVNPGDLVTP